MLSNDQDTPMDDVIALLAARVALAPDDIVSWAPDLVLRQYAWALTEDERARLVEALRPAARAKVRTLLMRELMEV